jgi:hypothetical protein
LGLLLFFTKPNIIMFVIIHRHERH